MRWMKLFISVVAVILLTMLVVGFLLPGEWTTTRSIEIEAPASEIWPRVEDLARWDEWAPIGDVEAELSSPSRGPGATRAWDDAAWGQGVVTVESVQPGREMVYRVAVEDGALTTTGTLSVDSIGSGSTRVSWTEAGDFGWNPLLSWFALGMEKRQGAQLAVGLERLRAEIEGG